MIGLPLLIAQESTTAVAEQAGLMNTLFQGIDEGQRFVLLIVGIGCFTAIVIVTSGIIAGVYTSIQKQRMLNELKQDMLDRGMNADEISEVIKAAPVEDFFSRWADQKSKKRF